VIPALAPRSLLSSGIAYVNVYLNDEDVRVLDGLETPVSSSDTVVILPAMAGGRCETPH
jgi:molybdopterin converting factor small subunit